MGDRNKVTSRNEDSSGVVGREGCHVILGIIPPLFLHTPQPLISASVATLTLDTMLDKRPLDERQLG